MFAESEIPKRLLDRDEVLSVLIAWTMQAEVMPLLTGVDLSHETTVHVWLDCFDLQNTRTVGRTLNELFGVSFSEPVWKTVLTPAKERNLGDVCDFVSRHAQVTAVLPVTVMGDTSIAAGAFLSVRQIVAKAGVNVSDLRPSSEIAPILRQLPPHAIAELMRLAPGRLPALQVDAPFHQVCSCVFAGCWLLQAALSFFPAAFHARVMCLLLGGFSGLLGALMGRYIKPRTVALQWTRTFKDLARVIVGQRCPTGIGFPLD